MKNDEIFEKARKGHLITVGFLTALKANFDPETAFRVAVEGFTNYMENNYRLVLGKTREGSQERFDLFRKQYEDSAEKSTYLHIVESTPTTLKVRFVRCPFSEVMEEYGLSDLAYAFCLSDPAFTKKVLPGVVFSRDHVIVKGDPFCDHTWIYNDPNKNRSSDHSIKGFK